MSDSVVKRRAQSLHESDFVPYTSERSVPPGRVLVFAPHADDEVLGCAGAIMRHVVAGDLVEVIIVTDSTYGEFAPGIDAVDARRQESTSAAAILGYGVPEFWGKPDRGLFYSEELVQLVLEALRERCPNTIYAPSIWEIHPDHYAVAVSVAEAIRRYERPISLMMYEVGVPLHPNLLLDITDLLPRKRAAIACFDSQLRVQPYDRHILALNAYRTYTLRRETEAAEAFRLVQTEALRRDFLRLVRPALYYGASAVVEETRPLVTVLVAAREMVAVVDAIDSVMLQTYANLEILLLCNKARGAEVLERICARRFPIRLVEHLNDPSRGIAMTRILEQASGEFFIFMEGSDVLEPGQVHMLVRALVPASPQGCAAAVYANTRDSEEAAPDVWRYEYHKPGLVLLKRSLLAGADLGDGECNREGWLGELWTELAERTCTVFVSAKPAVQ